MKKKNEKIDFVILWVDGNDPKWLEEKKKYIPDFDNGDSNGANRYRDWDNLKYWFRGVEKFAPWVNKIYFVTWGHIPEWLDTNNKKLKIINHSDYIPRNYLPTYNSNTIELNLFRLKELSENFVLFNDDQFIINKITEFDYFKNNLPVEYFSEIINTTELVNDTYSHNLLNNMAIVNKYFKKKDVYKKNIFKYLNFKYGFKGNLSTICLMPFSKFSLIENQHLPVPLKKSVIKKLWDLEFKALDASSLNRHRNLTDLTQFLVRYFQICLGDFYPKNYRFGKSFALGKVSVSDIDREIKKHNYKVVCFNDTLNVTDFEKTKKQLNILFENLLPEESSFEK